MNSLYLWIDLLSISVPLIFSFHPRLKLVHDWKFLFPAIVIAMAPYIIWDVIFTRKLYWGFNSDYLTGNFILDLPIEEWLFFICIPYACLFTYYSVQALSNKFIISDKSVNRISLVFGLVLVSLILFNSDKAYTITVASFTLAILAWTFFSKRRILNSFYPIFLIILIPFLIVNGILTGSGITNEVVWYNDFENLGIRLLTIPVEDSLYAFSLILLNLFLFEKIRDRFKKRS